MVTHGFLQQRIDEAVQSPALISQETPLQLDSRFSGLHLASKAIFLLCVTHVQVNKYLRVFESEQIMDQLMDVFDAAKDLSGVDSVEEKTLQCVPESEEEAEDDFTQQQRRHPILLRIRIGAMALEALTHIIAGNPGLCESFGSKYSSRLHSQFVARERVCQQMHQDGITVLSSCLKTEIKMAQCMQTLIDVRNLTWAVCRLADKMRDFILFILFWQSFVSRMPRTDVYVGHLHRISQLIPAMMRLALLASPTPQQDLQRAHDLDYDFATSAALIYSLHVLSLRFSELKERQYRFDQHIDTMAVVCQNTFV